MSLNQSKTFVELRRLLEESGYEVIPNETAHYPFGYIMLKRESKREGKLAGKRQANQVESIFTGLKKLIAKELRETRK